MRRGARTPEELESLLEVTDEERAGIVGRREAFAFARKLTVAPQLVVDEDVAALRRHFTDHEAAELVFHIANAAFFNRVTEAARLQLE
jgi:alkylhydroperoxidase family enzyme